MSILGFIDNYLALILILVAMTKYRCSIGFSMLEPGMSLDDLYKKADESMYRAKQEFYKSHSEMDRRKGARPR